MLAMLASATIAESKDCLELASAVASRGMGYSGRTSMLCVQANHLHNCVMYFPCRYILGHQRHRGAIDAGLQCSTVK